MARWSLKALCAAAAFVSLVSICGRAAEIPTDFTPYVRLGHLLKVSVYQDPILDASGQGFVNPGKLVREEGPVAMPVGSGTIISAEGLILTNWHVYAIEDQVQYDPNTRILRVAERASMTMLVYRLYDNDPLKVPIVQFRAEPISLDEEHDTALLKIVEDAEGNRIDRRDFSHVALGNPFGMKITSDLTVLGYPGKGGDTITITTGKFLGYYRDDRFPGQDGFIKTDAAMSPGNSGGAALSSQGLVGVPTAVTLPQLVGSDMGYIHPVTWALKGFVVAQYKFGLHPPEIPLEWLASSYNSDETAENTFLTGHVQASDSGQGTETQVIAVRPDKTLEEIGQLHQELQSAARVFLIQQMHEYGVPEEDIARRFEVPLDRVREILRIELSDESVSEDIRRYLGGEFYYANSESDEAGFFILTVPRKSAVILHVLKDGFFPFHQDIRAGEGAFQDLGRLQIYRHRHPTSPSLNPPTY
jgi:S1-C subfamily serine protease